MGQRNREGYAEFRSRFRRFYDSANRRLVYVGATADASFWDRRWMDARPEPYRGAPPRRGLVVRETLRALPSGSLVLEGGCGLAVQSWHLNRLGYRTVALDYAQKTLQFVRGRVPEVGPVAGDVFRLPLKEASVDGYWSLGVIEHFYSGYDGIRSEMRRVIRPGGYLFLTFPSMSGLRKTKAALRIYPDWKAEPAELERFYQFALPARRVAEDFEANGFQLVRSVSYLGVSGLTEETGRLGRLVDRALSSPNPVTRRARAGVDMLVRRFSSHVRLLVLRRDS